MPSKKDFRVLQRSFKGVSRKIEGLFNGFLSGSQWCFKIGSICVWMFQICFEDFSRRFSGCFKEDVRGCRRVIQERFKGI